MLQTPNSEPPERGRRATSGHVVSWVFFFVMRYRWKFDWSRRRQVGAGTRVSLAWAKLFDVGGVSSDHLRPFHYVSHAPWNLFGCRLSGLFTASRRVAACFRSQLAVSLGSALSVGSREASQVRPTSGIVGVFLEIFPRSVILHLLSLSGWKFLQMRSWNYHSESPF